MQKKSILLHAQLQGLLTFLCLFMLVGVFLFFKAIFVDVLR